MISCGREMFVQAPARRLISEAEISTVHPTTIFFS